mmetsp:Transcript_3597/g.22569  ORF Transcript_3597/g.22569 Transcript_3597/m.22569 type:complete len:346 (+) Transcript_3597:388-1425(+)
MVASTTALSPSLFVMHFSTLKLTKAYSQYQEWDFTSAARRLHWLSMGPTSTFSKSCTSWSPPRARDLMRCHSRSTFSARCLFIAAVFLESENRDPFPTALLVSGKALAPGVGLRLNFSARKIMILVLNCFFTSSGFKRPAAHSPSTDPDMPKLKVARRMLAKEPNLLSQLVLPSFLLPVRPDKIVLLCTPPSCGVPCNISSTSSTSAEENVLDAPASAFLVDVDVLTKLPMTGLSLESRSICSSSRAGSFPKIRPGLVFRSSPPESTSYPSESGSSWLSWKRFASCVPGSPSDTSVGTCSSLFGATVGSAASVSASVPTSSNASLLVVSHSDASVPCLSNNRSMS